MSHCPTWLERALDRIALEPLLDTRLSTKSLLRVSHRSAPRSVLVGVGLCTQSSLSQAIPFDLLGMLLPAEQIRRAIGASELIALVADSHAAINGFDETGVERCARSTENLLARLKQQCGLDSMSIVRASSFHGTEGYRALLHETRRRVSRPEHEYVLRQIADTAYLHRARGGILKVGWALGGPESAELHRRDELAFDRMFRAAHDDRVGFVYCKPGRSLSDESPKVSPYVATRPQARICLRAGEQPEAKLADASREASRETVNGYRRYLKAILYTYGRYVSRLPRARLEARLRYVIRGASLRAETEPAQRSARLEMVGS